MSPRQTSHRGSALFICSRRSASLSAGAAHRDDCGPVPQSPPASLPAASLPVRYENTPPALQKYSHKGYTTPPSDVLITKPHDSAGAHRRACARIADSVCVINRDLLRKFINGKETAKIADIPAQFTPAHALAASVLTDIRGGVVELIRHRRTVIPAFISPVIPHTGVRQHDATGKQRPIRLGRCSQHKRGRHGCQLRHLLHHPAVTQLLLGSASGLPATKFTASRKRAYTRRRTTVAPTRLCRSSAIPVTRPNRLDTVSDGLALLPFPLISKPLPSIGYA